MRFYRVHLYDGADGSAGYKFFTVQADAKREARQWDRDRDNDATEVEALEIEPTKAGILDALNFYAGHPNNG